MMFAKATLLASALLASGVVAYNGREFPFSPTGQVYQCGFAVEDNDDAAFVSPTLFNASHCGMEIQSSSPWGLGETITPILAGIYQCEDCEVNDIFVTPDEYARATTNKADEPYISTVWNYKTW
ncbi:hypothetical protein BD626DRAFT_480225 [Schizophyllum amplum]|uniref:RlpA-like double-psi beta-barrel-protein domain-containing protein-containing protein n=1 Tax=Schizophyllum amplum TaxID=97359 RepID=A0A550CT17_9AGAR|nr:hypothetical protein BD626DRAFT_480225 [Auriculariopsis ampla]